MTNLHSVAKLNIRLFLLIAIAGALTMTIRAQSTSSSSSSATRPSESPAQPPPTTPGAKTTDVATMDSTISALYDVISGPAGKRDWDRFRSLFISGARLIPTGSRPTGEVGSRVLTVDDYVQRAGALFEKEGFFEREASRQVERFGNQALVDCDDLLAGRGCEESDSVDVSQNQKLTAPPLRQRLTRSAPPFSDDLSQNSQGYFFRGNRADVQSNRRMHSL